MTTLTKPRARPGNPTASRSQSIPVVRCAIYTRKSTEEGLEQEFNSLDAQRESGEAYIRSQQHEGWQLVPTLYDDGGFTGGNLDRPALQRLMADIEAGKIDCVVVYKVDRLSRSLLDFSRLLEVFEKHQVAFCSVTQLFNTSSSMGRLVLNVLLSFAQFEREIISERTRDKIAAARRKGKWSGGMPLLGYDIDSRGSRLRVNEDEADRVRTIYQLYWEYQSLSTVVRLLEERGWQNKRWTTRKGNERGGNLFTKTSLHKLLTNVVYAGKLRYKLEIHAGEQPAIVAPELWQAVQTLLQRNGRTGGTATRNQFGALLKGLLRCVPCDCAMTPTHSTKHGNKRYRYYVCCRAQQRGWQTCPSKSIPAAEIENFVVEQIRHLGRDPELVRETLAQAQSQAATEIQSLTNEEKSLTRELARWHADVRDLVAVLGAGGEDSPALGELADRQERIRTAEQRAAELREQIQRLEPQHLDPQEVATIMSRFDPVWNALTLREQARVIGLLVARVDYDGARGKVAVTFHPDGLRSLAAEFSETETDQ